MLAMPRLSLLLLVLLFPPLVAAQVFEDDFDDGNDEGWTRANPLEAAGGMTMWTFPNGNSYRIAADVSPDAPLFGPARSGSFREDVTYEDALYLAVDLVGWDENQEQDVGLLAHLVQGGRD